MTHVTSDVPAPNAAIVTSARVIAAPSAEISACSRRKDGKIGTSGQRSARGTRWFHCSLVNRPRRCRIQIRRWDFFGGPYTRLAWFKILGTSPEECESRRQPNDPAGATKFLVGYNSATGPRATSNFSISGTYDLDSDGSLEVIGKDREGKRFKFTTPIYVTWNIPHT
jgi:hypothetical protein